MDLIGALGKNQFALTTVQRGGELGPALGSLADDLRPRLLRHRDDGPPVPAGSTGTASV